MQFIPKKLKFKKHQKGHQFNRIKPPVLLNNLSNGTIALKALNFGRITSKQLESAYKIITKSIRKSGTVFIRVYTHTPVTKKPIEVRMGKGKGNVEGWVAKIRPGTLLFELETCSLSLAKRSLKLAQLRLGLKTNIVLAF